MPLSISANINLQPSQKKIEDLLCAANLASDEAINTAIKNLGVAGRQLSYVEDVNRYCKLEKKIKNELAFAKTAVDGIIQDADNQKKRAEHALRQIQGLQYNSLVQNAAKTFVNSLFTNPGLESISSRFQVGMLPISELKKSMVNMVRPYQNLSESLKHLSRLPQLPEFALSGANREIYTTSFAINTLAPLSGQNQVDPKTESHIVKEIEHQTSNYTASELGLLENGNELLRLHTGAHEALRGNNPDRARHILTSLRELWGHLLRWLAPDELVLPWINDLIENETLITGQPTRKATVLYIVQYLQHDTLSEFLISDTKSFVKLIKLFHHLHKLDIELTHIQRRSIIISSDSRLMYMRQIAKG